MMATLRDLLSRIAYPNLLWVAARRQTDFLKKVRFHRQSQYASPEHVRDFQLQQLRSLVQHARRSVPWYREAYAKLNLPADFPRSLEEFSALPFMTRTDLRKDATALISDSAPRRYLRRAATSGSTGEPVSFYLSRREDAVPNVMVPSVTNFGVGYRPGMRYAQQKAAPPGAVEAKSKPHQRLMQYLSNHEAFAIYSVDRTTWRSHHEAMQKWRPHVMFCYANAIADLARFLRSENIVPNYPRVCIITCAEILTEKNRAIAQEVFQKPVYNHYGTREFWVLANECVHQDGLHTIPTAHYIEVVDPETGRNTDGPGEVVITSLCHRDVPWIRYKLGDWGRLLPAAECRCGRTTPRLVDLQGRVTDVIYRPDGKKIHGLSFGHFLWRLPTLEAYQIEQTDMNRLILRMVHRASPDESLIAGSKADIQNMMGPSCTVDFEIVDAIPASSSGKRKFVINRIRDKEKLLQT